MCQVMLLYNEYLFVFCFSSIRKLVTGNSNINLYLGLQVETECGKLGNIVSSFGADGILLIYMYISL